MERDNVLSNACARYVVLAVAALMLLVNPLLPGTGRSISAQSGSGESSAAPPKKRPAAKSPPKPVSKNPATKAKQRPKVLTPSKAGSTIRVDDTARQLIQFWIVPFGATPPIVDSSSTVPCQPRKSLNHSSHQTATKKGKAASPVEGVTPQDSSNGVTPFANLTGQTRCPTIDVSCPEAFIPGTPLTFTASVNGADPREMLTYNWSISAGYITAGQGTPSITVDTSGLGGQTVTASVEVGGIPSSCVRVDSCSSISFRAAPQSSLFDSLSGRSDLESETARLDNFAIALQRDPGAQGYVISYADRFGRPGQAQARADRAKDYLVNTRGIDAGRIITVDAGCR